MVSISAISAVDNSTDVTQEMGFNEVMDIQINTIINAVSNKTGAN